VSASEWAVTVTAPARHARICCRGGGPSVIINVIFLYHAQRRIPIHNIYHANLEKGTWMSHSTGSFPWGTLQAAPQFREPLENGLRLEGSGRASLSRPIRPQKLLHFPPPFPTSSSTRTCISRARPLTRLNCRLARFSRIPSLFAISAPGLAVSRLLLERGAVAGLAILFVTTRQLLLTQLGHNLQRRRRRRGRRGMLERRIFICD
jgi:hypothetical protein